MPQVQITSILGGFGPAFNIAAQDQYYDSIGIDPEGIGNLGGITGKSIAAIMPTFVSSLMSGTSNSGMQEPPMWVSGSQSTTGIFVYGASGSVYVLTDITYAPAEDGALVKPASGSGNGMVAYNDYLYVSTATDIYKLGRLSQTQPLLTSFWVTGLSNSALVNTTYPASRGVSYPNHVMHFHNDGKVYVADYDNSTTADIPHGGLIHWFKTDTLGTNATSQFAALVLPPGFMPMAMESYGTNLAILCSPQMASGGVSKSGNSALFLWDTVSNTYYRHITINDGQATAMKNKNGELYIWTGESSNTGNCKLLKYLGSDSFQSLATINEGYPPFQSAVEVFGNMICWGGSVTAPTIAAGVFTYGYRSGQLKSDGLHMPVRINNTVDTLPVVTSVKAILGGTASLNYPIVGWQTNTAAKYGLDRITNSGTQASIFRSKVFHVGKPFRIRRIRIPMTGAISAGDSITPIIYVDNFSGSKTLQDINATNFPNGERLIDFNSLSVTGYSNFHLYFTFNGTNQIGLSFPITIDFEIDER